MQTLHATATPQDLARKAAALIQAGQTTAARPLLAAARRAGGASPELSQLAALLALRDGAVEDARGELDLAVAETPDHAGLRKIRAELRHRIGDTEGAARDAAEAVILDPADPIAKALLGTLMLELGRHDDARTCLAEALRARPADPAIREALANALAAGGRTDAALAVLEEGIGLAPTAVSLRNALVMQCIRRRDFTAAVRHAEAARAAGIADACLFGLLGHALSSLDRHADAALAYQDALRLGPDDPYVRHLAAAAGTVALGRRAPEAYLRTVFDGYADRFESHLIALDYRVPGAIRTALQAHPEIAVGRACGPLLDLGCGTGLVGLAVSDLPVGPLTGIDISPRMLDQARVKGLYATLIEGDLLAVLGSTTATWPLIVAGDVLCYFGALEEVFAAVHARLAPGGWFVFSLETLLADHDGTLRGNGAWALQRQGRYAHAAAYVQRAARDTGFRIRQQSSGVIRNEAGLPVSGMVCVLEPAGRDA